jgi:hypothetical protein
MLIEDSHVELDTTGFLRLAEGVGDTGIATPELPRTSVMLLIINEMGMERFTYALCDEPGLIHGMLERMDERHDEVCRLTVESGRGPHACPAARRVGEVVPDEPPPVGSQHGRRPRRDGFGHFPHQKPQPMSGANAIGGLARLDFEVVQNYDDFDVLLTSPGQFAELVLPRVRRMTQICHAAGKKLMIHACGHLRELLPSLAVAGYDAHHYLSSRPVGNLEFEEAIAALPESMVLMPALDPLLLEDGTPDEVFAHAREVVETFRSRERFIVMTSMKPRIPEDNLYAVRRALRP